MLSFDSLQHLLADVGAKPLAEAERRDGPLRVSPAGLSRLARPRASRRRRLDGPASLASPSPNLAPPSHRRPVDPPEHRPSHAEDLRRASPRGPRPRSARSRPPRRTRSASAAAIARHRRPRGVRVGPGPRPRRHPRLEELPRAADRGRGPGPRHARRPVLRRRRPVAVRRPDARRTWATPTSRSMTGGFQAWKSQRARLDDSRPSSPRSQKQRYSRHLLIPEVGSEGQAKLLELEGAAHRRGRARLAGRAVPRRGGRRARSGSSTSTSSTCRTSSARSSTPTTASARRRSSAPARRSTRSTPT